MKTTKFLSVLSIALIFIGVNQGFSRKVETLTYRVLPSTGITYDVIIHQPTFTINPCGVYLVEVADQTGRLVAPAQVFTPGIDKYTFNEKFTAVQIPQARREAKLVPIVFPGDFVCEFPLSTRPDVKMGPFFVGQTYIFNLYPNSTFQPVK
jgi:hypothetical protein